MGPCRDALSRVEDASGDGAQHGGEPIVLVRKDGAVEIRIEARDLPSRSCGPGPEAPEGRHNVHVGVQRRGKPGELLDVVPGDASSARWCVEAHRKGDELKGPYIEGRPGDRFIYLSWVDIDEAGTATMFRRAKLMLDAVTPELLTAAERTGVLTARLGLTDDKGGPRCGRR